MVSVFLSGCLNSTDPREGGFFGGVAGLTSGTYEERVRDRQESLERAQALQRELEAEQAELDALRKNRASEVASAKSRMNDLQRDTRMLAQMVRSLEADNRGQEQTIRALQEQLDDLQRRIQVAQENNAGEAAVSQAKRSRLEEQRKELEREYRLLLDLYLKLGK